MSGEIASAFGITGSLQVRTYIERVLLEEVDGCENSHESQDIGDESEKVFHNQKVKNKAQGTLNGSPTLSPVLGFLPSINAPEGLYISSIAAFLVSTE